MNQNQNSGLSRRGFLGLATLGITGAAVSACGGGPSTSADAGRRTDAAIDYSKVQPASSITFWTSNPGHSEAVTRQIVDAFHATQPGIEVNLVTAGSNYEEVAQKYQTARAGGDLPDLVILSDVWWFSFYMNDAIIPLDALIKQVGIQGSDYVDSLWSDYTFNGAQWAVPWSRSTPIFYYNKDHWKKAGLPDRAPHSWAEFARWAPRLQSARAGAKHAFQLPALVDYAGWTLQNNLWGWGGGWSKQGTFDMTASSAQSVAALQFLQDAVYRDKWAGVASQDSTVDLGAGAVSSTIASTGSLVGVLEAAKGRFDVGAGFLPGGPREMKPVCPTGGAGLAISKSSSPEAQLAAAMFLQFLTNPDNTLTFAAATGYMPVRKSADTSSLVKKSPLSKIAIDQLAVTRSQDYARVFLPGADHEMANTAANILTSHAAVSSELTTLQGKLQDIYETKVKPNVP